MMKVMTMNDDSNIQIPQKDNTETFDSFCAEYLKPAINNLLWTHLPPSTTLEQAESFACDIFEKIRDMWETHEANEKSSNDSKFHCKQNE